MKEILSAFICFKGCELTSAEAALLSKYNPAGVILFRRNVDNPIQLKKLTDDIRFAINRQNVLIAVDQEGGSVQRLKNNYWREYISQQAIGSLPYTKSTELIKLQGTLIAADLNAVGINVNLSPVADIVHPQTTIALKSRCFSDSAEKVITYSSLLAKTYMANGICPCMKHLPGHGLAQTNSHLGTTVINANMSEIEKEIMPFTELAKFIPLAMTAHIIAPAIDDKPITQSKQGIDFIRNVTGFHGLIISDALEMHSLQGTLSERAKLSLDAGCDIVCYCSGHNQNNENMILENEEVLKSCRPLSDNAYFYLDKITNEIFCNKTTADIKKYNQQYDALIKEIHFPDLTEKDYTENWSDKN